MRHLIIYDITDDSLRNKVSELLKNYGLQRIQYSAFVGELRRDKLKSLTVDLKKLIGEAEENVQIFPVCYTCFRGRIEIGKRKRYEVAEEKPKVVYI